MCDLPQTTTSALRAPQSIMGSAGPSWPNRAQNHWCCASGVGSRPGTLLAPSCQLAQRHTTAPDSCLRERKRCGWQPRRGDRTQGQLQHETQERGRGGQTWPHYTQPRRCAAGERCPGSDPWANSPPPRVNWEAAAYSPVPASAVIMLWDSEQITLYLCTSVPWCIK